MTIEPGTKTGVLRSILLYTVPAALFCLCVLALWPYMRYYVDADALSYLNIVKKYVEGDYQHAINAFWSPMGCWLTVLTVKGTGLELFTAAIVVNAVSVIGLIVSSQRLFNRFRPAAWEQWCFGLMSAGFWTYALYFQSFTDFWQYFLLTAGLLILLKPNFTRKAYLWVLMGLMAALAYFSKAYSFFFFPFMIFAASCIQLKQAPVFNWKRLVLICGVAGCVMLLTAAPWLWLLHEKYGIWTNSTAGKLNASWWLVGTQEFRSGITVLVPPPYQGSLFYFEDPYLAQGRLVHFYDSPALFVKQLLRIGYNGLGWVNTDNRISPFFFATWLITLLLLCMKNIRRSASWQLQLITIIYLVYPLPFWLFTFEGGRYTWFIMPVGAILSMIYAEKALFPYLKNRLRQVFTVVFFLTYIVSPVTDMRTMLRKGEQEYNLAQELKKRNINGSFVCNKSYADAFLSLSQLSWFSQCPWYCHTLNNYSNREILTDAQRYRVKYYFYLYDGAADDYVLTGLDGQPLPDITGGSVAGLKVFQLQP